MRNGHLVQTVRAAMRQSTGRAYPEVEALLDTMTVPQLQDLLRLIRDVESQAKSAVRSRARRRGLGHLF